MYICIYLPIYPYTCTYIYIMYISIIYIYIIYIYIIYISIRVYYQVINVVLSSDYSHSSYPLGMNYMIF